MENRKQGCKKKIHTYLESTCKPIRLLCRVVGSSTPRMGVVLEAAPGISATSGAPFPDTYFFLYGFTMAFCDLVTVEILFVES